MITLKDSNKYTNAGVICDSGLGNKMFQIAGTIGIAIRNGWSYGFEEWESQEYFVNPLLKVNEFDYPIHEIGWDFSNELVPDNVALHGYMQSFRYWKFCEETIRYYFEMKDICEPLENTIGIHFRAYGNSEIHPECDWEYYERALQCFSKDKTKVVFTDNIERAQMVFNDRFEIRSGTPIEDFYLLSKCDGIISSNGTFPWWPAWLSGCKTVLPLRWFGGRKSHLSTDGFNYPGFIKI